MFKSANAVTTSFQNRQILNLPTEPNLTFDFGGYDY